MHCLCADNSGNTFFADIHLFAAQNSRFNAAERSEAQKAVIIYACYNKRNLVHMCAYHNALTAAFFMTD